MKVELKELESGGLCTGFICLMTGKSGRLSWTWWRSREWLKNATFSAGRIFACDRKFSGLFFLKWALRNGTYYIEFSAAFWRRVVIMCTTCLTVTYPTFCPHDECCVFPAILTTSGVQRMSWLYIVLIFVCEMQGLTTADSKEVSLHLFVDQQLV